MAFHKLGCGNIVVQQSGGVTVSALAGAGVGWRMRGRWNNRGAECHLFLGVPGRAPGSGPEPPPMEVLLNTRTEAVVSVTTAA